MENEETIQLFSQKNGSDKLYTARLYRKGNGWAVEGLSKARSAVKWNVQPKIEEPIDYETAKRVFDYLVHGKMTGDSGYQPVAGTAGADFTPTAASGSPTRADTGLHTELLIPVKTIEELEPYFKNNDFWGQRKHDGERRPVRRDDNEIIAANKNGLVVALRDCIKQALLKFQSKKFVLDDEHIADILWAFDLLENGRDYRGEPYWRRYGRLEALFETCGLQDHVKLVETSKTEAEKRAMFLRIRLAGGEGMVFKNKNAAWRSGLSGNQWKFQFRKRAACIVSKQNEGVRSVAIHVLDENGQAVSFGSLTIPGKKPIPLANSIVEVEYLWANKGGAFEQPVFKGERQDYSPDDCRIDKIVFKGESDIAV